MEMTVKNGKKVRSVEQYLTILKAAGKSGITIRNYRQYLDQYAQFLGVPIEELHLHLNSDDLVRYAMEISHKKESGRKTTLSVIHRYMALQGVEFDELEHNVSKVTITEERDDKPLTLDILQKMMDQGDAHSRAIISFLISTGARAGETSKLLFSDVGRIEHGAFVPDINGNVIHIRNEIAKRKKGGLVFLTAEAREFLTVWLKDRNRYIAYSNMRTKNLYTAPTHHAHVPRKETGDKVFRPNDDQRLFACAYTTFNKTFGRLYDAVDGERQKKRDGSKYALSKITTHDTRAYFRTHAVKSMSIDLVEGILRHTGYLNAEYVRMTPEDRYAQFRKGEETLYITRADQRKLTELEKEITKLDALRAQMSEMQTVLNFLTNQTSMPYKPEEPILPTDSRHIRQKKSAMHFQENQ